MIALLIRGIVIYVFAIGAVRLMGKRQIGQLQPSELVITILLSEIASMPLQDSDTPLFQSIVCIFLLVSLEVIFSVVSMKWRAFRTAVQGHSIMVINKGQIVKENMKLIRYSVDDLTEALRLKDVFDLETVDCAYIETNGSISVKLKSEDAPLTPKDIGLKKKNEPIACLVISDGKIIEREFSVCNLSKAKLKAILNKQNLCPSDVLIMTYRSDGKANIIKKEV